MYSCTLFLLSALDGSEWSTPRTGRFLPGRNRYPLYRRLGGPQSRSGRGLKVSPPPEFYLRTAHPVESSYTDGAIPVHMLGMKIFAK